MIRLIIAVAWMGAANLQNAAQWAVPVDDLTHFCGDPRTIPPGDRPKPRGSDCAGACHAAFRRCGGLPGKRA